MKAGPQSRRRQTATLVEQAQRVMRESRKLLEQRQAQLKQREQFLVRTYQKLDEFMEREAAIRETTL
jgi:hypothetical protein